ncbi:CDP-alcohol phosphatidyltransferase family protein [Sediminicoccus sp. KRV36]|uniref:CDP-alcohol phosphatidyltransferase family protein n=1 Tax=Sediminicoccus sp. KRV36 TaxID=3133721 RepID=UPI00200D2ABE|nr:CDP-alcohol phosphatidyltransferase family protein [Sediminicoccus rosea]UPY37131.1 CDP-alcohol phosphatidyltransferase family protein [Sediminicoccus rosea]
MALVPRWVSPDMLTGLGIFGAMLGCLGFAMALTSGVSLSLVAAGFGLNWLGDSLDGRLARLRRTERRIQGFILDNGVDLISYLLLALGFAMSGLVSLPIPFLLLSLYVLLSNLALARLLITGVHDLAIDAVGTTELRVAFVGLAALLFGFPEFFRALIPLLEITVLDFLSLFWASLMLLNFVIVLRRDIRNARQADESLASRLARDPESLPP